MGEQQYEYHVEPMSIAPDELRNERYELDDVLNDVASDGWVLESTLRVDSSTFLFVFARPVES